MSIVPNLSYSDEHSSNCQCISLYRRNPQITPALCSKCSSTTKYLGLTESVKDVGHRKTAPENTILLNIESYEIFKNTLGVQYLLSKLKLQSFKSTNFGFKDTSSLAITSNYKMWSLHQKNFIEEKYNSSLEERDQVTEIPKKAVVDDILILSSLYN